MGEINVDIFLEYLQAFGFDEFIKWASVVIIIMILWERVTSK